MPPRFDEFLCVSCHIVGLRTFVAWGSLGARQSFYRACTILLLVLLILVVCSAYATTSRKRSSLAWIFWLVGLSLIELKYKDRVLPKSTKDMDPFNDSQVCLGMSETLGSLRVCPALEQHVGEQLHLEPLAAKERG